VQILTSKGLLDDDSGVAEAAYRVLAEEDVIAPTKVRLRALERAIATGRVNKEILSNVSDLQEEWKETVHSPKPKADIAQLLKGLDDPNPKVQANSREALSCIYSPEVQKVLVQRGLDYSSSDARKAALDELHDRFVVCDKTAERHLSLLRDALNDPDPEVRILAAACCGLATRVAVIRGRETDVDKLVDLFATTALLDKDPQVARAVFFEAHLTDIIAPSKVRLRALDRAIATGRINKMVNGVTELQNSWKEAIYGPNYKPPKPAPKPKPEPREDDPFR